MQPTLEKCTIKMLKYAKTCKTKFSMYLESYNNNFFQFRYLKFYFYTYLLLYVIAMLKIHNLMWFSKCWRIIQYYNIILKCLSIFFFFSIKLCILSLVRVLVVKTRVHHRHLFLVIVCSRIFFKIYVIFKYFYKNTNSCILMEYHLKCAF